MDNGTAKNQCLFCGKLLDSPHEACGGGCATNEDSAMLKRNEDGQVVCVDSSGELELSVDLNDIEITTLPVGMTVKVDPSRLALAYLPERYIIEAALGKALPIRLNYAGCNIPLEDCEIVGVCHSFERQAFGLKLRHPDFDIVSPGCEIRQCEVEFVQKEASVIPLRCEEKTDWRIVNKQREAELRARGTAAEFARILREADLPEATFITKSPTD